MCFDKKLNADKIKIQPQEFGCAVKGLRVIKGDCDEQSPLRVHGVYSIHQGDIIMMAFLRSILRDALKDVAVDLINQLIDFITLALR